MQAPRFWRALDQRYNLIGVRCERCGDAIFPSRSLCPKCRHLSVGKLRAEQFSGDGEVVSFTTVHVAPLGFELQTPYVLAIVKLAEGPKLTTQIVDCKPDEVKIGMKVHKVFRRVTEDGEAGVIHYGYKFSPVRNVYRE